MRRIIDADALKSFIRAIPDISGLGCEPVIAMRDVLEMIDHVPIIDSIPVEWLQAHKTEYYEDWGEEPISVEKALKKWQREREG